ESHADMMATAETLARMPIQAVKIHNLYVVRNTPLEEMHLRGQAHILEREEYVTLLCDFLERLPGEMVLHRLSGDAPPDYLVAPLWCLDKPAFLQAVDRELERRDGWQGKRKHCQADRKTPAAAPARRLPLPLVGDGNAAEENREAADGASQPGLRASR